MENFVVPRPELQNLSDYVPGKSIEEICEQYGLKSAVKLASNENPWGASPKAKQAYLSIAETLHLYPRGNAPKLLEALAQKYNVPKSRLIIGNGSDEIIDMIGKAFIASGDNCLGIRPTFSVYQFTTVSNGAEFISVGETEERVPLSAYLSAINERTRVIFICNPNNPTGAYYTHDEMVEFLLRTPKNVLVFLDEAYAEFSTAKDYPKLISMIDQFPNLLLNHTFSKIYGLAGLRLGFAISSEAVIASLWKIKPPFDVNLAAQAAAVAALFDEEFIEKTKSENAKGVKLLSENLGALGFRVLSTEGNFVCVKIGARAKELLVFLESRGMIVRGLSSFGLPEWIRVTVGRQEENELFLSLVKAWRENA